MYSILFSIAAGTIYIPTNSVGGFRDLALRGATGAVRQIACLHPAGLQETSGEGLDERTGTGCGSSLQLLGQPSPEGSVNTGGKDIPAATTANTSFSSDRLTFSPCG